MTKKLVLLLSVFIAQRALGQDVIYRTPDDFKKGKPLLVDSGTLEFYGKAYCKIGGVKKVFKVAEVFAVRFHGTLERFWDGHIYSVEGSNKYYYWHFRNCGDHGAYYDGYALSLGVDGPLYKVRLLNSLKDLAAKHSEFAPVYNCTAGVMASQPKESKPKGPGGGGINPYIFNCLAASAK